jgi:hypothetical protein
VDYTYYKVPAPWVQVKILRLVQMYPPPGMLFHSAAGSVRPDGCSPGHGRLCLSGQD